VAALRSLNHTYPVTASGAKRPFSKETTSEMWQTAK
jgi:hypothetical protein